MASDGRPVALVTGASSGIGEATALALARCGYAVALTARRAELLEQLAGRIRRAGGIALPAPADLLAAGQIEGVVRAVEAQLGPVAVLINNAGVSVRHRAWRPRDEVIDSLLGTNLIAPIRVVRAVAPARFHYDCRFAAIWRPSPEPARATALFTHCLAQAHEDA